MRVPFFVGLSALAAAQEAYFHPTFDVRRTSNVTYAQALACDAQQLNCKPMDLQLDVYEPIPRDTAWCSRGVAYEDACCAGSCGTCAGTGCAARPGGTSSCCYGSIKDAGRACANATDTACLMPQMSVATGDVPVPALKPAYIEMHGGGNSGGSKGSPNFQGAANFYTSRGFVSFDMNYRLAHDHGLLPPSALLTSGWTPDWNSAYPAVRDAKAAIRFVRANAARFGIDPARIAVSGGSAGATDMLAVGVTFEEDYRGELTVDLDPTLATTNLEFDSNVQCVKAQWASEGAVTLAQQHDILNRSRYSSTNAAVIAFHGDIDTTIPIKHAYRVQAAYAATGAPYELHVLVGCGHASYCYNGNGTCVCNHSSGLYYDETIDTTALPFIAKHLGLNLIGTIYV